MRQRLHGGDNAQAHIDNGTSPSHQNCTASERRNERHVHGAYIGRQNDNQIDNRVCTVAYNNNKVYYFSYQISIAKNKKTTTPLITCYFWYEIVYVRTVWHNTVGQWCWCRATNDTKQRACCWPSIKVKLVKSMIEATSANVFGKHINILV